ncbi:unnamed protein product [Kuraishia capsulata CBS 1993]|uniref:Mitochondrial pyruvate carrier n=1 Tax=Kuraishia capsulata CBS 1993 TaxID=1382522 RepID=W6MHX3_9ASCO|nr:uncharacterized protein KUCA_T00001393001 [Kuraishia capsulata CBS 1993]CDK25423.1 unnamed protein product [Kuraishia capsulata CBS 1993]
MSTKAGSTTSKFFQNMISKDTLKMVFTTHFWGPVSNFGIPIAAVMDLQNKPPDVISGPMTVSLVLYSAVFMRYAMAVTPANYLLFGCHFVNEFAQLGQLYRFVDYTYLSKKNIAN